MLEIIVIGVNADYYYIWINNKWRQVTALNEYDSYNQDKYTIMDTPYSWIGVRVPNGVPKSGIWAWDAISIIVCQDPQECSISLFGILVDSLNYTYQE